MDKLRKILLALLVASIAYTPAVFAEVEDDDGEEYIEKAVKQIKRLGDPNSKYKDSVVFYEIAPIEQFLKKARISKEDGKHSKAVIFANMSLVLGTIADYNAHSRYYQDQTDKHFLRKFEKEIKKQELQLLITSIGLKKKGKVYEVMIDEDDIFEYSRRRFTENMSSKGKDTLGKLGKILKDNPKAKLRVDYGYSRDYRNTNTSKERSVFVKRFFTDQLGIKDKQLDVNGVGRKFRKDRIEFTVSGL